jgi:polysaccharide pyruvyl transferase WcaK-like protein
MCGKKVVVYAVDCGELKPFSRKFLRWVGNKLDLIIARTEDSKERLIRFGVKKPVYVTTDTVFQYQPPGREFALGLLEKLDIDPEKPVIGLAVKEFFWFPIKPRLWGPKEDFYHYPLYHTWTEDGRRKGKMFKQDFTRYADYIIEKLDANVLLIAMERMDLPPSQDIHKLLKHSGRARVISSNDYDMRDISALLSTLKFLATTRYHACVMSVPSSIPLIAVSSDIRLQGVFREIGIMDYYIDVSTETLCDDLVRATEKLLDNEAACRNKIAGAYTKYLQLDSENRRILKSWFLENFTWE